MTTVADLKRFLEDCPDDAEVLISGKYTSHISEPSFGYIREINRYGQADFFPEGCYEDESEFTPAILFTDCSTG